MKYLAWCCEKKGKCGWPGTVLCDGLAWGKIPKTTNVWRKYHDEVCGGKLIQLKKEVMRNGSGIPGNVAPLGGRVG